MEKSIKEYIKTKLEQFAEVELENINCPFLYGEVELPECLKEYIDN